VKIALNRKMKGVILPISAYAFKHPPQLMPLETAEKAFNDFIKRNA